MHEITGHLALPSDRHRRTYKYIVRAIVLMWFLFEFNRNKLKYLMRVITRENERHQLQPQVFLLVWEILEEKEVLTLFTYFSFERS